MKVKIGYVESMVDRMIHGRFGVKEEGLSSLPARFNVGRFTILPRMKTIDAVILDVKDGENIIARGLFVTLEKPASVEVPRDSPPLMQSLTISLRPVGEDKTFIDAGLS